MGTNFHEWGGEGVLRDRYFVVIMPMRGGRLVMGEVPWVGEFGIALGGGGASMRG